MSNAGSATFSDDIDLAGSINMTGSSKVIKLNNGGFIDFDGNSLQLNTQRHPNTGAFHNTAKTHAGITLTGTSGNSRILFYTTATNNTAATERMRITSDGSVGIGTTSPDARFSVVTATANSTASRIGGLEYSGTQRGLTIKTFQSNGGDDCGVEFNAAEGLSGYGSFIFKADTSERMRIDSGGNIGIGTATIRQRLHQHVADSGANYHAFTNTGTGTGATDGFVVGISADEDALVWNQENTELIFATDNDEKMRIDTSGNVGINESSPTSKLHITDTGVDRTMLNTGRGSFEIEGGTSAYTFGIAMGGAGSGVALYHNSGSRSIIFGTDETSRMTINGSGTVNVVGTFTAGTKTFRIPHPLESKKDTHDLVHSCIESPQADNIYRGKVNLVDGKAEINIDEVSNMTEGTFFRLNRDVQCFTSNETDWDAVKGSVSGNKLTIECQNVNSTATVSWMVVGERQDAKIYASLLTDDNGKIIVEPLHEEQPQIET